MDPYQHQKLSERSILDYVITEEQFYEQINDMLIDEDKQFCPFRLRKQKGEIIITPGDHNPIILTLNLKKSDIPKFEQGKSVWKYTKNGLDTFTKLTSLKSFGKNIQFGSDDIQTIY